MVKVADFGLARDVYKSDQYIKGNIGEKINWSPTFFFHNSHTRKCVSTRAASFLGSSLFVTVGTRWIYRPRVLGSVFSGGEGEGAGERLSYFPKGQLVTILEDLITYIYILCCLTPDGPLVCFCGSCLPLVS